MNGIYAHYDTRRLYFLLNISYRHYLDFQILTHAEKKCVYTYYEV